MAQDLFRAQAIEFSTQRLYGHVAVRPRLSHMALAGLLLISICLLILALVVGTHVEKRRVTGELEVIGDRAAAAGSIRAVLYAPKSLSKVIGVGQAMRLEVMGFANEVGRVEASVVEVSRQSKVIRPRGSSSGKVYVPIALSVRESALISAGLPVEGDYTLEIATDLVIARESWLRWLAGRLLERTQSSRP